MAEVVSNITLGQLYLSIIAISIVCNTLGRILDSLFKLWTKAKAPEAEQDRRISKAEEDIAEIRKMLNNDNGRLKEIEGSNRLTQRALLELLKHGIDGNNINEMQRVRSDIENYLINK